MKRLERKKGCKMKKIGLLTLVIVFMLIPPEVYAQDILVKKLLASPDDFVGKGIVLQCKFERLLINFLNGGGAIYSPPPGERIYFSSSEYLGFSVLDSKRQNTLYCLFVKKNKGEILYGLNDGDRITIRGKVTSSHSTTAWIDVYEIKKGWK
jgi:hypothetical protein